MPTGRPDPLAIASGASRYSGIAAPTPPPALTISATGGGSPVAGVPFNLSALLSNATTLPDVGTWQNVSGSGSATPPTVAFALGDLNKTSALVWASAGSVSVRMTTASGVVSNTLPLTVGAAPPPPPPSPTGAIVQFMTSDGGDATHTAYNFSGPTNARWHHRLGFSWKRTNPLGNWLDSALTEDGSVPYASTGAAATVGQTLSATVTALVQRWMSNSLNRGFYLAGTGTAWPTDYYGRGDATEANRPKLVVTTTTGTFTLTAAANAWWTTSSGTGNGSKQWFRVAQGVSPAILRFDLSTVTGTVTNATLSVVVKAFNTGHTGQILNVYEADPPTIIVPEGVASPTVGIANNYATFNALKASGDPALIAADDFELGGPFDSGFTPPATRTFNSATGTTYARGTFATGGSPSSGTGSADVRLDVTRGTGALGTPDVVRPELYGQYSLYLENGFGTKQDDGIKIPAMGVQFGWWNAASGGYWQQTTGNGGFPGTGLKVAGTGATNGNFEYQGHSARIITGSDPTDLDDDPYNGWYSVDLYCYHLDQVGSFPGSQLCPMIAIRKEVWYTIDIRIKQNSMTGAQDALGNYATAVADGIYQIWINGYLAFSKTNYRWRRHAEFGVQGVWIDFYHGGVSPALTSSPYRVDRVAVGTSYIGPRFPAVAISGSTWTPNVDGDSRILDSDWEQLPLNTFYNANVTNNTIDSQIGATRYPTYLGASDGSASITSAWSGAAFDRSRHRMFMTGGGHSDSHYCENGVYELNTDTMKVGVFSARSPTSAVRWYNGTAYVNALTDSSGSAVPQADGLPPAIHTYDGLVHVPGSAVGNTNGYFFKHMHTNTQWNCDTGALVGTPTYNPTDPIVGSGGGGYLTAWVSYPYAIMPSANFYLQVFKMDTVAHSWYSLNPGGAPLPTPTSIGKIIPTPYPGNSGAVYAPTANIPYSGKMQADDNVGGVAYIIGDASGTVRGMRFRYGAWVANAAATGDYGNTGTYQIIATLTGPAASYFSTTNIADVANSPLRSAGCDIDTTTNTLWVCSNVAGGGVYKITGVDTASWSVSQVSGPSVLRTIQNGTYGRWRVMYKGMTGRKVLIGVRVNSTTTPPEVIRLTDPA